MAMAALPDWHAKHRGHVQHAVVYQTCAPHRHTLAFHTALPQTPHLVVFAPTAPRAKEDQKLHSPAGGPPSPQLCLGRRRRCCAGTRHEPHEELGKAASLSAQSLQAEAEEGRADAVQAAQGNHGIELTWAGVCGRRVTCRGVAGAAARHAQCRCGQVGATAVLPTVSRLYALHSPEKQTQLDRTRQVAAVPAPNTAVRSC